VARAASYEYTAARHNTGLLEHVNAVCFCQCDVHLSAAFLGACLFTEGRCWRTRRRRAAFVSPGPSQKCPQEPFHEHVWGPSSGYQKRPHSEGRKNSNRLSVRHFLAHGVGRSGARECPHCWGPHPSWWRVSACVIVCLRALWNRFPVTFSVDLRGHGVGRRHVSLAAGAEHLRVVYCSACNVRCPA
jgi:hypothetical protein